MAEGVPMTIAQLEAQVVADRVDARERIQEAKNVFTLRLQEIRARLDTIEQQLTP